MSPGKVGLTGSVALVLAAILCWPVSPTDAEVRSSAGNVGQYNGPGSCAASNCHGSVSPRTATPILQNEYSVWASQDKHSRAYSVLSNSVSLRIGKILKLPTAPNQAEKCLACHALSVPAALRAQSFSLDDGVSCEYCHGPAVGWLGPHTTRGWTHEQSLQRGMYDLRDLESRATKCMSCHVGTPEKRVDHIMIAAGHPDLTFELATFSSVMPRHWKFPDNNNSWEGVQEWAVGQAVQLREALKRLSRSASGNNWPEFAELDCFACHHSLTRPQDSWRQAQGYSGRTPGLPAWNASRYVVFRHMGEEVNLDLTRQLETRTEKLVNLIGHWAKPADIALAAQQAAGLSDQLAQQLRRQPYDGNLIVRVMLAIAADSSIPDRGERAAEQTAMALDSLYVAYAKNEKGVNKEARTAINSLFEQFDNPSSFDAPKFVKQMQKVRAVLPHASRPAASDQTNQSNGHSPGSR